MSIGNSVLGWLCDLTVSQSVEVELFGHLEKNSAPALRGRGTRGVLLITTPPGEQTGKKSYVFVSL